MKKLLLLFFMVFLLPLGWAGGNFHCPMNCEGEKSYQKAGDCPKCGMALKPIKDGESRGFRLTVDSVPPAPAAGQATQLTLTPLSKLNGSIVKDLEVVHEKPLHFFLIAQDLSWFEHAHPTALPDGTHRLEIVFPSGGNYVAVADFKPKGEAGQVIFHPLQVSGESRRAVSVKRSLKWKGDGFSVQLSYAGSLKANEPKALKFRIQEKGKPILDLEPVLGALGHSIAIHEDLSEFVHSHPPHDSAPSKKGDIEFHGSFPKPGLYKVWMQFRHQGNLRTSDFVVKVLR